MKKTFAPRAFLALSLAAALFGCASMSGWTVLVDGTRGLDNFNRVGDANWSAVDGAIQATAGGKDPGYLVTKVSYTTSRSAPSSGPATTPTAASSCAARTRR